MNLKIVYDNEAEPGFEKGWGFSCLIETNGETILFDAGWDGNVLISNMKNFDVHLSDINKVVLSHAHWDHIGGLPHILKLMKKNLQVYVPQSFSKRLKRELSERSELNEVSDSQKITKKVWTTGELKNKVEEQSLVLETKKGLMVVVGCSHPGVRRILSASSELGEIRGILGGMHDFEDFEVLESLDLVAPCHCTAKKKEIAELFPEKYVEARAGFEIEI